MKHLNKLMIACVVGLTSIGMSASASAQSVTTTNVAGDSAYWSSGNAAPTNLSRNSVMSGNLETWSTNAEQDARNQSIQVAAASLGSQAGLAARTEQIKRSLMLRASEYDRSFDFSRLMLEPGFIPPVISEGRNAYNQPNDNEARASDLIFRIERPARIVSANPTWRTYLLQDATPAVRPETTVLPKTREEKALWDVWAQKGWDEGARLADANFEANLARLKQDFEGMVRFKSLYQQGLVSKPRLERANLGVTGGGDEMAINDRIIRITESAMLDANKKNWGTTSPRTTTTDK